MAENKGRIEELAHDLAALAAKHRLHLVDDTIDWAMAEAEQSGEPWNPCLRGIVKRFRAGQRGWIGEPFAEDVTFENEYADLADVARRGLLRQAARTASILT